MIIPLPNFTLKNFKLKFYIIFVQALKRVKTRSTNQIFRIHTINVNNKSLRRDFCTIKRAKIYINSFLSQSQSVIDGKKNFKHDFFSLLRIEQNRNNQVEESRCKTKHKGNKFNRVCVYRTNVIEFSKEKNMSVDEKDDLRTNRRLMLRTLFSLFAGKLLVKA